MAPRESEEHAGCRRLEPLAASPAGGARLLSLTPGFNWGLKAFLYQDFSAQWRLI